MADVKITVLPGNKIKTECPDCHKPVTVVEVGNPLKCSHAFVFHRYGTTDINAVKIEDPKKK